MPQFTIRGGRPLTGRLTVQGAKNSVLPILSACLLCQSGVTLARCPRITDVDACVRILRHLGFRVTHRQHTVAVTPPALCGNEIPAELMSQMRSSITFLGPLLARAGEAALSQPGGCALGPRPIDMHLDALCQMGAQVEQTRHRLLCRVPGGRLHGAAIHLRFPSVGATENVLMAAATAKGVTQIINAAREPEIEDLAAFLNACGANITGAGTSAITVYGVPALQGAHFTVMPDRIAAATYLAAVAVTGGEAALVGVEPRHLDAVLPLFRQCGCKLQVERDQIRMRAPRRLGALKTVVTGVYPAFPTDAQPPLMAMACVCAGPTLFAETVFSDRFRHAQALNRMGAAIQTRGKWAVATGVDHLLGARVPALDLRGGAALVVAGLAAGGETVVTNGHYIQRGYEDLAGCLRTLQADVTCE